MDIQTLINTCTNDAIKAMLIKLVNKGDNLHIYANDDANALGRYVVSYGGYTVVRK
jgi:hypothetical protein